MVKSSKANEELVEEALSALRRVGFAVDVISYPPEERGFDIVAYREGFRPLLVKVSENLKQVSKVELEDLRKSSRAYNVVSLLIASKSGSSNLEDDVIYEKQGILALTTRTLEKSFSTGEKPIVIHRKGNYFLKVNSRVFVERLKEYGYSRSELAEILRVTKKTIYLYERGELLVPLDKGLLLAQLLGEDIFEELDPLKPLIILNEEAITSDTPRDKIEEFLWKLASRLNKLFLNFTRTPVDVVVKNNSATVVVAKATYIDRSLEKKIEDAEKIADLVNAPLIVVKSHTDVKHIEDALLNKSKPG
jgi:putative transcriptional regulator